MAGHMSIGGRRTGEHTRRGGAAAVATAGTPKKKVSGAAAWREARELLWKHRRRLSLGLALMLVSRVVGLVVPASPKYLIDEVIQKGRTDLLAPIALAVLGATVIQAL